VEDGGFIKIELALGRAINRAEANLNKKTEKLVSVWYV
jgi:hypothetical protein